MNNYCCPSCSGQADERLLPTTAVGMCCLGARSCGHGVVWGQAGPFGIQMPGWDRAVGHLAQVPASSSSSVKRTHRNDPSVPFIPVVPRIPSHWKGVVQGICLVSLICFLIFSPRICIIPFCCLLALCFDADFPFPTCQLSLVLCHHLQGFRSLPLPTFPDKGDWER